MMAPSVPQTRFVASDASVLLDLTRGLAALVVVGSHWRELFFVDFPEVMHRSRMLEVLCAVPYLLTGAGHQAVMVFFVLSGYLIGGSVFGQLRSGEWRWAVYLTHRMARLWTVLLPGLLLCMFWDRLGLALPRARPLYLGLTPHSRVGDVAARLSAKIFFGNLFFVQPMLAPTFGSDKALWSLSNEFWYYILFPLAAVALWRQSTWRARGMCLGLFAVAAWFVGGSILWISPAWLMGCALAAVPAPRLGPAARWTALVVYLPAVFCSKAIVLPGSMNDYLVAFCTALFLWVMLSAKSEADRRSRFARWSRGLSRCSYTLYVVHLPVLVLAAALLVGSPRWQIDGRHLAVAGAVLAVVGAYAYGVAWLTEFRTAQIRSWAEHWLGLEGRPVLTPHELALSSERQEPAQAVQ